MGETERVLQEVWAAEEQWGTKDTGSSEAQGSYSLISGRTALLRPTPSTQPHFKSPKGPQVGS